MAKIVCIGLNPALDTTIELECLEVGQVNRSQTASTHAAGKALNVASLLSKLGHQVAITGFLGQDNAQAFVETFATFNIDNHCVLLAGATRQNIKIAEADGRMTDINGVGFKVDDNAKQKLYDTIAKLVMSADFVVVAGSLPMDFEMDDFARLLKLIKQSPAKLVVDTSGRALKLACDYQPYLIKPNRDEVLEAFGLPSTTKDEQARFVRQLAGVSHVVISMAEAGVVWWQGNGAIAANTPKVAVKSTVGAGDTLLSGLIHGLINHDDKDAALAMAVAMAAHTVSVVGVELPSKARLDELVAKIKTTKFS